MNEPRYDIKMEKVQELAHQNIERVKRKFTGKIILHWYEGELKEIEKITKRKF